MLLLFQDLVNPLLSVHLVIALKLVYVTCKMLEISSHICPQMLKALKLGCKKMPGGLEAQRNIRYIVSTYISQIIRFTVVLKVLKYNIHRHWKTTFYSHDRLRLVLLPNNVTTYSGDKLFNTSLHTTENSTEQCLSDMLIFRV